MKKIIISLLILFTISSFINDNSFSKNLKSATTNGTILPTTTGSTIGNSCYSIDSAYMQKIRNEIEKKYLDESKLSLDQTVKTFNIVLIIVSIIITILFGFGAYYNYTLKKLKEDIEKKKIELEDEITAVKNKKEEAITLINNCTEEITTATTKVVSKSKYGIEKK